MSAFSTVLKQREAQFSDRLRSEHSTALKAHDVLTVEDDLGTGAVAFQLSIKGKRLLFRALGLQRKTKLRAAEK